MNEQGQTNDELGQFEFPGSATGQDESEIWIEPGALGLDSSLQPQSAVLEPTHNSSWSGEDLDAFHAPTGNYGVTNDWSCYINDSTRISQEKRQLPRRRSRYLTRHAGSAGPVIIPNGLNPIERWRNSPPEEEPALIPDILNALEGAENSLATDNTNAGDAFQHYRRAPSTTSDESGASSRGSQQSVHSNSSARSALGPKENRGSIRKRKPTASRAKKQSSTNAMRRYCCTFCCDRFKSKYDWARHEKSLHVTLEAWHCAPFGTVVHNPASSLQETSCAFCGADNPDAEHLTQHAVTACQDESGARRSFRRKDHLAQHLRLVHGVSSCPGMDSWKIGRSAVSSRCGLCNQHLSTWEERVDHLAEHFRTGQTMADWDGEHEFPADFAGLVANALPPYLIAVESHSMIPFSATNCDVQDHFAQITSRARYGTVDQVEASRLAAPTWPSVAPPLQTIAPPGVAPEQLSSFTQVLTLHLSRFAREQMERGVIPSDEMFQEESRRLLYDSEDAWNQTIADNPEWMSSFRQLHCGARGEEGGGGAAEGVRAPGPEN
ncbi:hypothetical protein BJX62DRAFT_245695 [Aspergillus germanicus]